MESLESMNCPRNHGPMKLVEDRMMSRQFACEKEGCSMRFKVNTRTGEVTQIATGLAAIGGAALFALSFLFGGDDSSGGT